MIDYIGSLTDRKQIPEWVKGEYLKGSAFPRVAFVGRSNVGKSSLLNALVGKTVARISAQPGKTRAIHFFSDSEEKKIWVDLPGYGYAKVSQKDREAWGRLIEEYMKHDQGLICAVLLWDSRHGPSASDLEALGYFVNKTTCEVLIVMTKFDLLKTQSDRARRQKEARLKMEELGLSADHLFWTSIKQKKGVQELFSQIRSLAD